MVNFNGELLSGSATFLNHKNRGFRFGDSLFEELRVAQGKIIFLEEHYFRLMASMRMLRMEIPMNFTMEFLQDEILKTIEVNGLNDSTALVRITICRLDDIGISPKANDINYVVDSKKLDDPFYLLKTNHYEVELFKDFLVNPDMLSNLDTGNKTLQVTAGIYAHENGYQDCLLLNVNKQVVGAITGNLFVLKDREVKTSPLSSGTTNSIVRKKLIEIIDSLEDYTIIETPISPFELQKADELFILSVEKGIQPITKYRKKKYGVDMAKDLLGKLNATARLASLK